MQKQYCVNVVEKYAVIADTEAEAIELINRYLDGDTEAPVRHRDSDYQVEHVGFSDPISGNLHAA